MNLPGFTAELALEDGQRRYRSSSNRKSGPAVYAATIDDTRIVCGPCIRHGRYGYKICYHVVDGVQTLPFVNLCDL
jgi:hypothetical protein